MFGDEIMQAFREFKALWDPTGKMNPGKVIDAYPVDTNLRWGTNYAPWEPATHFAFAEDRGSFAYAANRCVGTGKCRKHDSGTMCPSYMATREEKHSTRGRSRLLFEMLRGRIPGRRVAGYAPSKRRSTSAWRARDAGRVPGQRRHGDVQGGVPLPLLPSAPATAHGLRIWPHVVVGAPGGRRARTGQLR